MPTTIDSAGITFNDATSLTSANIGTAQLVNGSVTAAKLGTTEQTRIAKAWVNFNGTTSPGTIRSSYNVSSVTKNGTGDYTVNFATAMADANYSQVVGGQLDMGGIGNPWFFGVRATNNVLSLKSTTQCRFMCANPNFVTADAGDLSITVFGN